jgi:predicted MFS family arabinose efflux permease
MNPWRATVAGLCASLVGIGLARFAYTPLIPALIAARWFEASQVVYLGAANLAGYLAGALLARRMAARAPAAVVLRGMMALATAAFFACSLPLSFLWYFVWRFAAGLAGGALMSLAAPTVLPYVPPSRRGLAGGAIFTGVGLGIAASGTLVPPLLRLGLVETWCGLGLLSLALTVIAWGGWPADAPADVRLVAAVAPRARRVSGASVRALYVEYGLNAVGLVPHMVFLVDFVARGLGQGLPAGAHYWVLFGLGAVVGPVAAGAVADRIGFAAAVRLAYLLQAAAIGAFELSPPPGVLAASSVIVGAFVPGIVPLVLGRTQELVPDEEGRRMAWSFCTTAFAVGQAAAAYGFSFLFARGDGYDHFFALGAAALALALALDLAVAVIAARRAAASM